MNPRDANRRSDATNRFETSPTWRKLSHQIRRNNPLCQALEKDGRQCTSPSVLVHHLIAPESNWDLALEERNCVALCQRHHATTPGDAGCWTYAPTILFDGTAFAHPITPAPRKVDDGNLPPTGTPGAQQYISSAVGAGRLDRALAEPD